MFYLIYGLLIVIGVALGILAEIKNWTGAGAFVVGLIWGSFLAVVVFVTWA